MWSWIISIVWNRCMSSQGRRAIGNFYTVLFTRGKAAKKVFHCVVRNGGRRAAVGGRAQWARPTAQAATAARSPHGSSRSLPPAAIRSLRRAFELPCCRAALRANCNTTMTSATRAPLSLRGRSLFHSASFATLLVGTDLSSHVMQSLPAEVLTYSY